MLAGLVSPVRPLAFRLPLPMNTAPQPPPPFFVSRLYSLVKRLAWGFFISGILAFAAVLDPPWRTSQFPRPEVDILILAGIISMPIILVLWSVFYPRHYAEKPSFLTFFLFFPMLGTGAFLSGLSFLLAYSRLYPPMVAL